MKLGNGMSGRKAGLMTAFLTMIYSMGMSAPEAIHNSANPKTLARKIISSKWDKKKPIGRNQRKRRKLIRQNPSLTRSKRFAR